VKKALKAAFSALALIGAMTLVTEIVLAGVLFATGVITPRKAHDLVKVVKGELASAAPEEDVENDRAGAEQCEIESEEALKAAVGRWRKQKAAQEDILRERERAVESMLRELATVEQSIDSRQEELEARVAAFEAERAAAVAAERDEGFARAVEHYTKMDARDVAELLYDLDDATVVRYLKSFSAGFAAEVLTEIKEVDEREGGREAVNRAALLQELMKGEQVALARGGAASASAR